MLKEYSKLKTSVIYFANRPRAMKKFSVAEHYQLAYSKDFYYHTLISCTISEHFREKKKKDPFNNQEMIKFKRKKKRGHLIFSVPQGVQL